MFESESRRLLGVGSKSVASSVVAAEFQAASPRFITGCGTAIITIILIMIVAPQWLGMHSRIASDAPVVPPSSPLDALLSELHIPPSFIDVFQQGDIDFNELMHFNKADIVRLNLPYGPKLKLWTYIQNVQRLEKEGVKVPRPGSNVAPAAEEKRKEAEEKLAGVTELLAKEPVTKEVAQVIVNTAKEVGVAEATTPSSDFHVQALEPDTSTTANERREAVKAAFLHAWKGYEQKAWGHDEARPVSGETYDPWNGYAATMIDGLDTAMIMGLDKEVAHAREYIEKVDFRRNSAENSFFEFTIRYLGGLLAAFELSKDRIYLDKARELGDILLASYNPSTGLPPARLNFANGQGSHGGQICVACLGSHQLEFEYLSYHTGDRKYANAARNVVSILKAAHRRDHRLYPKYFSAHGGAYTNDELSFGAEIDSFYEYLLKLYLLTDRKDQEVLQIYNDAIDGMEDKILRTKTVKYKDEYSNKEVTKIYSFLGEDRNGHYHGEMQHLTCFMPGLLALGASLHTTAEMAKRSGYPHLYQSSTNAVMTHQHTRTPRAAGSNEVSPKPSPQLSEAEEKLKSNAAKHAEIAEHLLNGCAETYLQTATGIGPESFIFDFGRFKPAGSNGVVELVSSNELLGALFTIGSTEYILRPETIESVFYLYRLTGDESFRDLGWRMFQAIEKQCKSNWGYSALRDVNVQHGRGDSNKWRQAANGENSQPNWKPLELQKEGPHSQIWEDRQESFFLAETLKYLYLLFSPRDTIPLDKYVFNTEAHPLGIIVDHE